MKTGFYSRLAWNNIKKNYRFFIPRILCEAGLAACLYIALTICKDDRLDSVTLTQLMGIGVAVLSILSIVLMLYINSFLMKQRTREFGLYNVLGMEKRHIGRILFFETMISGGIAIAAGLCFGMVFYKVCSLLICRLLETEIVLGFDYITLNSIVSAAWRFVVLDTLTFVISRIRIARMKPVEMLGSASRGESEPKVKWLMLVLGVLTLGAGYTISVTNENPAQALLLFFLAVVLVIIGTYFLFVTGTVFVLKRLKANNGYYYKKNHMPAVSGLLYRMKQNAVGLASIAILSTGVLVMISTTVTLYAGYKGFMKTAFPQDLYLSASTETGALSCDELEDVVLTAAEKNHVEIKDLYKNRYLFVAVWADGNSVLSEESYAVFSNSKQLNELNNVINVNFITEAEYERDTGEKLALADDEIAVARIRTIHENLDLKKDVEIVDKTFHVKKVLDSFPISNPTMATVWSSYGIIVKDETVLNAIYQRQKEYFGEEASEITERVSVVFADRDAVEPVAGKLQEAIVSGLKENYGTGEYDYDDYWESKETVLGLYGSLLFLGILLGAVCLFATTLIIYYKQISEGYEDRTRFQIMEKVGMSQHEVKKTINAQVLLVFLLPLAVSGVHLVFASPMLEKMLAILGLFSNKLFVICAIVTFLIFALVYVLIYKGTSKTYYKIVK